MINRIRDIRKAKNLTLADVAARCTPPTTAQTIGRLETGMRQLSLTWMNRIAAALEVEPELLVRTSHDDTPRFIARMTEAGAEPLTDGRQRVDGVVLAKNDGFQIAVQVFQGAFVVVGNM